MQAAFFHRASHTGAGYRLLTRRGDCVIGDSHTNGDAVWGVRWGMSFAFGYSVVASIISLAGGALGSGETRGMLVRVIVAYFLAGAGAGFVVGLMRQRMKTTAEVRIASMAAGVPAWAAVGTVSFERIPYEWDQAAWMSYGACVLLYGPIIGLLQRRRLRRYVGSGSLGC